MRILVIDDYRNHGESLLDLLRTLGHDALYAQSYEEAQWLLELFRFDLAVLDFDMPGTTGPAAARHLAARCPTMESVIVSAHALDSARRAEVGELAFLAKPVHREALAELLHRIEQARVGSALIRRGPFAVIKYK